MLDAKVLAAVFASLTAVAAAINGGSFNPDMAVNGVSADLSDVKGLNSDPVNALRDLLITRPEPTNDVEATLKVSDLSDEKIKLQEAKVAPSGLRQIKLGAKKLSSDSEIRFGGFKGSLEPGEPTKVQGTANSVVSSGVNITGVTAVSEKANSSTITVRENGRARIVLSNVEGQIVSGSASTEFRENTRKLKINSFSGEITLYPFNNTLTLDGKVDRLSAGQFSFGS